MGEAGSRFTDVFEMLVIDWPMVASVEVIGENLRLGWIAVDCIMQRAIK